MKLSRWWRGFWGNRSNLSKWDYEPSDNGVVVSFTTIPSRIADIKPTILSLLRQTKCPGRIEINLAKTLRKKSAMWQIPEWLRQLKAVQIHWMEQDLGPASKSIPTLIRHQQQDPFIVIVDDDMVYSPYLIEDLWRADQKTQGKAVFCVNGHPLTRNLVFFDHPPHKAIQTGQVRVAIVEGAGGYGLHPSQFDLPALLYTADGPEDVMIPDDIWISGHLSRRNIPKYQIPIRGKRHSLPQAEVSPIGPLSGRVKNSNEATAYFAKDWKAEELIDLLHNH